MRRVTRNGVLAVAAASGAMAVTLPVSAAFAAGGGSTADGTAAGSPGLISGNTVQVPVHVPLNVCGNTVDVVGLLNPAAGNTCVNEDSGGHGGATSGGATAGGGTSTGGGSIAEGDATDSAGLLSGNGARLPVRLPVNVSGNSVNAVGVGNPSVGNRSVNTSGDLPDVPGTPDRPTSPTSTVPPENNPGPEPAAPLPPDTEPALAHTGADHVLPAAMGSAALVLGGAAVYRRFRSGGVR
ncbi:chaplin [Streptomyces sp. NPDC005374]|uniref:chaplin n=1 Tax=Streptomyces sp. NPDC005374 TaxID=3364713 RepID=UPI00369543E4